jgi:HK97 family phage major capsid protein
MDIDTDTVLETKDAISAESVVTHAEMMRAFEEFKQANDARTSGPERRSTDVLLDEKLIRIDKTIDAYGRRLDEIALRTARPAFAHGHARGGSAEHKAAFETYVRSGENANLRVLESKALSVGSNPDGGFLVPPEIEMQISQRLIAISPIRSIAGTRTISSNIYRKPFMTTGPAVGWAGETDARAQTASPSLDELSFPAMELFAMPAATAMLLEDSAVNIDEWLAQEVEQVFAAQEGAAFIAGDGNNKPKGFLSYSTIPNSTWTWGNVGYIASGVSGAFPTSNPSDVLVDLVYAVNAGYRQNAAFIMNRKTQSAIRKFKDTTGNYLWQPPATAGGKATLMTFPVIEAEDMPDIAVNALSIAFGDFFRGYLVVDRAGVRVLRDPYTAKPYVLFYTTKRVGGGIQDFDAIKLMKFAVN